MSIEIGIVLVLIALAGGAALGAYARRRLDESQMGSAEQLSAQLIETGKKEAETLRREAELQAKDTVLKAKSEWEGEARELRRELQGQEKRLIQRDENLDRKDRVLEERDTDAQAREKQLARQESSIQDREAEVEELALHQAEELERVASMTSEEARQHLMTTMESQARHDAARGIKQIEDEARETADKKSKEILALAIQRYAGDYVAEKTVSVVALPSDEMKGRIIGREGRNIRAIEAATGIDLIIDDTPEAVIISGFNPVRREVARLALEKLVTDGRIHPARIEEIVQKAEEDVNQSIRESGEQATFDVGVHGIHAEVVRLIGRLKYRTSYGQNILKHSLEVAFLCGVMASELGINVKQAKRAGLLHDLGKAVDHEVEGSHAMIGADLARKYGESAEIIHAIAAHHEEEKPTTILAVLVQAADALSGARPGARREMLETYVKRLEELEKIGTSFAGVESCYAIQAGREIRVMVSSDQVSDAHSHVLARDIAQKIEGEMTYPGQIKVNVIRETRAIGYAK
ncbi:MAG: ribonuclease Y [Desulfuromonadales bacterium C00003068]|nr:MAG: ribonuclease Y [Desulfuromonadales bacterium C00003068]